MGLTFEKAKLGYKQELRRNFTLIEVFGIAFSIMGLLPSIASTLAYSIPAGPVGMVWVCGSIRSICDRSTFINGFDIGLVPGFGMHLCCWLGHGKYQEIVKCFHGYSTMESSSIFMFCSHRFEIYSNIRVRTSS